MYRLRKNYNLVIFVQVLESADEIGAMMAGVRILIVEDEPR